MGVEMDSEQKNKEARCMSAHKEIMESGAFVQIIQIRNRKIEISPSTIRHVRAWQDLEGEYHFTLFPHSFHEWTEAQVNQFACLIEQEIDLYAVVVDAGLRIHHQAIQQYA
jgi:hypothetical protein